MSNEKQYDLLIGWEDVAGSGSPSPIIQDVSVLKNVPESDQKLEFGWKGYDCLFCVCRVKGNREKVKLAISKGYDEFVRSYGLGATDPEEIENIKEEKAQLVKNKIEALTGVFYDGDVNWIEKWLDKPEGERVMYDKGFANSVYVCLWKNVNEESWIFSKEADDILKEKFKANCEEGTVTSYDGTVESLLKHLGELYLCTKDVQDCSTAHVFDSWWDSSKKLNKREDYDGDQYYGYCCENNVTVVKIRNQCLVGIREESWDGLLFSWGEEICFEEDIEKKKYLKVDGNLLFDWSIGR